MSSTGKAVRPFTGRHMAAIMVAFFGVVIAVNVYMARLATSTFTGVVVENSYVAGSTRPAPRIGSAGMPAPCVMPMATCW